MKNTACGNGGCAIDGRRYGEFLSTIASHGFLPGGGEYANVASSWLRYVFKDDAEPGEMFVGADCSLCTNPTWETLSKGLD